MLQLQENTANKTQPLCVTLRYLTIAFDSVHSTITTGYHNISIRVMRLLNDGYEPKCYTTALC